MFKWFRRLIEPLRDPRDLAMEREEVKAAARYWRERVANARLGSRYDGSLETTVSMPLTQDELDRFEHEVAYELAGALAYTVDSNKLFTTGGVDILLYLGLAVSRAELKHKIVYTGWFSRLRILPGVEVAYERPPYQSQEWVVIWTPAPTSA